MKRKLCATSFNCEDDMEELNAVALSSRKESSVPLTAGGDPIFSHPFGYPLAVVLRLRVLQIVCGISKIIMGSVAFIEERQKLNMGLGIPAGSFSVLAAAVSIHTSRGWAVVTSGTVGVATAGILWIVSICMLLALIVQCFRTILEVPSQTSERNTAEEGATISRDLIIIAVVQIALASATLVSALICATIDFKT